MPPDIQDDQVKRGSRQDDANSKSRKTAVGVSKTNKKTEVRPVHEMAVSGKTRYPAVLVRRNSTLTVGNFTIQNSSSLSINCSIIQRHGERHLVIHEIIMDADNILGKSSIEPRRGGITKESKCNLIKSGTIKTILHPKRKQEHHITVVGVEKTSKKNEIDNEIQEVIATGNYVPIPQNKDENLERLDIMGAGPILLSDSEESDHDSSASRSPDDDDDDNSYDSGSADALSGSVIDDGDEPLRIDSFGHNFNYSIHQLSPEETEKRLKEQWNWRESLLESLLYDRLPDNRPSATEPGPNLEKPQKVGSPALVPSTDPSINLSTEEDIKEAGTQATPCSLDVTDGLGRFHVSIKAGSLARDDLFPVAIRQRRDAVMEDTPDADLSTEDTSENSCFADQASEEIRQEQADDREIIEQQESMADCIPDDELQAGAGLSRQSLSLANQADADPHLLNEAFEVLNDNRDLPHAVMVSNNPDEAAIFLPDIDPHDEIDMNPFLDDAEECRIERRFNFQSN